jgi:hypothetical protein
VWGVNYCPGHLPGWLDHFHSRVGKHILFFRCRDDKAENNQTANMVKVYNIHPLNTNTFFPGLRYPKGAPKAV